MNDRIIRKGDNVILGNPWSKWVRIDVFVRAALVWGANRATLAFVVVRSPKSGNYRSA